MSHFVSSFYHFVLPVDGRSTAKNGSSWLMSGEVLVVGFQMAVGGSAVTVGFTQLDADQIQLPVTHAAFGDDLLGKLAHSLNRPFEHDRLDTLIMIEMCVHG